MAFNNPNNFPNNFPNDFPNEKDGANQFPFWAIVLIMIFFLMFILLPIGLVVPSAFPIVAGVFIPFFGIALVMFYTIFRSAGKIQKKNMNFNRDKALKRQSDSIKRMRALGMDNSDKIDDDLIIETGNGNTDRDGSKKKRYCPYCGERLEPDENICPTCGMSVN